MLNLFENNAEVHQLADHLSFSLTGQLHPLALLAAKKLQQYLQDHQDWEHNFGLSIGMEGVVIGKMFGVLVVRTMEGKLGYLFAFSGKLAGKNDHANFVPPIFDGLAEGGFLNEGMLALSRMSEDIRALELAGLKMDDVKIKELKLSRKNYSATLQNKIFDQYHFINKIGESKALRTVFENTAAGRPSAGAGECAAPKLLQYAFENQLEPLALAEFWWGLSPKSANWKHGEFYQPCKDKCAPILAHMLS